MHNPYFIREFFHKILPWLVCPPPKDKTVIERIAEKVLEAREDLLQANFVHANAVAEKQKAELVLKQYDSLFTRYNKR